jgi:cardiolipin synthase
MRTRLTAAALSGAVAVSIIGVARKALRITERSHWPPHADAIDPPDAQQAVADFAGEQRGPRAVGLDYARTTAATIEPWAEGAEFYPRIMADVEAATSSIHILMFGWKPGDVGSPLATLLEQKLAAGVEVRILVDSFGSRPYGTSQEMFTELADAGAQIVVSDLLLPDRQGVYPHARRDWSMSNFGRSDHRKLYVIDGAVMWTGGAGIEDHFGNGEFHDVMVRLTGDVVRQAQAVFLTSFCSHSAPLPNDLDAYFVEPNEPGVMPVALTQVVPGGFVTATEAARELIDTSTDRLDIMNPYLTDPDIIGRILRAAERGVKVRIVVSKKSNNFLATAVLRNRYADLAGAGVEIWECPGTVVHAKLIVSDDRVMFGTLNLDAWALYRNFEFALVAGGSDVVAQFEARVFEPDIARSEQGVAPAGSAARAVSALASRLAYFL